MNIRQEIYCHNCGGYVQFDIDVEMDGNHVLHCPNCGHEHLRVVRNGRITDQRWGSRNAPTIPVNQMTVTYTSVSVSSDSSGNTWSVTTSSGTSTSGGNGVVYTWRMG